MASMSLPALRDRSVGVKRGQNPNIGVEAAVSKLWGEKRTKPKHWGFPDYYPKYEIPNTKPKPTPSVLKKWSNRSPVFFPMWEFVRVAIYDLRKTKVQTAK